VSVVERLRELGLELPAAPEAVASFEPVVGAGDLVYTSGQIATGPDGSLVATGRVGAEVDREQARRCAETCALNVLAQLERTPGLDRIERLVKLTVFVASAPGFREQHVVANGASDLLVAVLGERGRHARSAVGVAELPLGSPVEIEAIARVGSG
jgi:enamine deaminase RidA (YjgF/YER057c/UK114 family)